MHLEKIVLVVIGILIALQINNWNENRKLQNEELSLFEEVKGNLETTSKSFVCLRNILVKDIDGDGKLG